MKLRSLIVVGLAAALCLTAPVIAQDEAGRGGRSGAGGGRGGFPGGGFPGGGMLGGGQLGGGALELVSMLRMEEVRDEIELSPQTYEAVKKAQAESRGEDRDFRSMSEDDRAKMMADMNTKAQDLMEEVLTPKQQTRLVGLFAQQRGLSAVTNKFVAKEVGLDEAGVKKVEETVAKARESMGDPREKMREIFSGGDRDKAREAMQKMMEETKTSTEAAINATLTDAQKKAFEELKGEKFEFPESQFGGRGGPGGRGGASGGRGERP